MNTPAAEVLIPVAFFTMLTLVVYFTARFNYLTKKEILEKGGGIEMAKRRFPFFELGITIIGIGVGLLFAVIPQSMNIPENIQGLFTGASILVFGGAGIVLAFFLRKKLDAKS